MFGSLITISLGAASCVANPYYGGGPYPYYDSSPVWMYTNPSYGYDYVPEVYTLRHGDDRFYDRRNGWEVHQFNRREAEAERHNRMESERLGRSGASHETTHEARGGERR